jgi:cation transport ATPase
VLLLAVAVAGLAGGIWARLAGAGQFGDRVLTLIVAVGLVPLTVSVARALVRREPGVDVIALLAMAGALALGEVLAGAVIAVMLVSGRLLETYAGGRARRELRALLERAPRVVRCTATRTAGWPRHRWPRSAQGISCWSSRARSYPSTGSSRDGPRSWTNRL